MKFFVSLLATILICGCGGGGGSSSQSGSPSSSTDGSANNPPSSKNNPPSSNLSNSIVINPLRDLGRNKGDRVCFRIKSYNNVTESDFSGAICNTIKNSKSITLSWNSVPGDVLGYYVYYGIEKNNVSNFLEDVIES